MLRMLTLPSQKGKMVKSANVKGIIVGGEFFVGKISRHWLLLIFATLLLLQRELFRFFFRIYNTLCDFNSKQKLSHIPLIYLDFSPIRSGNFEIPCE